MNLYCIVMFELNYSIGDIRNSDLGEGIVCLGEGSGGKEGGKWGKGGREVGEKGEGSGGKGGGKWGMPTPLSTPSPMEHLYKLKLDHRLCRRRTVKFTLHNSIYNEK